MKRTLSVLLLVCVCLPLVALRTVNPLQGKVSVAFDLSYANKKFGFESLVVNELFVYSNEKLGKLSESVSFYVPFNGNSKGLIAELGYEGINKEKDGLYLGGNIQFEAPVVNGKLVPESITGIVNVESHRDLEMLIDYTGDYDNLERDFLNSIGGKIGYRYSFGNEGKSDLFAGIDGSYYNDKIPMTVKAWAEGSIRFDEFSVGAQVHSNYNMISFTPQVEYKYSVEKGNRYSGLYLSLEDLTFPLGASVYHGFATAMSLHKGESVFIVNYIHIPLEMYPLAEFNGKVSYLVGSKCIDYVYEADNDPKDNGFFFRFNGNVKLYKEGNARPYLTVDNYLDFKPVFENKKFRIDIFTGFDTNVNINNNAKSKYHI